TVQAKMRHAEDAGSHPVLTSSEIPSCAGKNARVPVDYLLVWLVMVGAEPVVRGTTFVMVIFGTFEVMRTRLVMLARLVIMRTCRLVFGKVGVGGVATIGGGFVFLSSGCLASKSSMRKPASEARPLIWAPPIIWAALTSSS